MHTAARIDANPLGPAALIPTGGDIAVIARQPIVDARRGVDRGAGRIVGAAAEQRQRAGAGEQPEQPAPVERGAEHALEVVSEAAMVIGHGPSLKG